jgi:hypothetical protein
MNNQNESFLNYDKIFKELYDWNKKLVKEKNIL